MTETMTAIHAGTWALDPSHTEIGFTVRHLMSKVRGTFEDFESTIVVADSADDSAATATIQLASINTGAPDRDNHIRSSDFFGVDDNATMSFTATSLDPRGENFTVVGDLTIKDVTHRVELAVDVLGVGPDPWGGTRIGFEAGATISRKAWGIDFNVPVQGDKVMIGDKVTIAITAQAVLQS